VGVGANQSVRSQLRVLRRTPAPKCRSVGRECSAISLRRVRGWASDARGANLGDVLTDAKGGKFALSYRAVDGRVEYSLDEVNDPAVAPCHS
jgi:hypothetical protein